MSDRDRLIHERGKIVFDRENSNQNEVFDVEFVSVLPHGKKVHKIPIDEERRKKLLQRAERELIEEGVIAHA